MSKHRDYLIARRIKHNPKLRDVIHADLDFLEHDGALLDDDEFDAYLASGEPLPHFSRYCEHIQNG